MSQTSREHEALPGDAGLRQTPAPWALAALVLAVFFAVGYSIDSDRSLSEREGVVTQTDAENDVIPSLPPDQN
jgi:hypothetical protein